jgi:hypothetical protein
MQRTRHYPPSQIKYQLEHPPVTVHLNKKLKEIMDAVKGQRSYAQFITEILEEKFNLEEEIKRLPLNEAVISYARGFEEAEGRYAQIGTCIKCKGETTTSGQTANATNAMAGLRDLIFHTSGIRFQSHGSMKATLKRQS